MTDRTIRDYLGASPRAMGLLFVTLLLSRAGTAAAGCGATYGP